MIEIDDFNDEMCVSMDGNDDMQIEYSSNYL